jgi:Holliday junction resolvase RusA-like endonuclease
MSRSLDIKIPGTPIPQGRPKVATKPFVKVYYSKTSVAHRKLLVAAIREAWGPDQPPMEKAAQITLHVAGARISSDLDNHAKQILDALVDAGVLKGDSLAEVAWLMISGSPSASVKPADRHTSVTVLESA